jgi:hypothetical protein
MLKLVLTICLITLISSSHYSVDDILTYYSLNIGKVYTNNTNYIKLLKADSFSLIRYPRSGIVNLTFNIQVEALRPDKTETVTLSAHVVRLYLITLERYSSWF